MNDALIAIKQAKTCVALVKQAIDWTRLLDPKFRAQKLEQMEREQKGDSTGKPSPKEKDRGGFRPRKTLDEMTIHEVSEELAKRFQRVMDTAKVKEGKLHLTEEQADAIMPVVEFILKAPIENKSAQKQKLIVNNIIEGDRSGKIPRPGWKRTLRETDESGRTTSTPVYLITVAQLSLIATIYQNFIAELTHSTEKDKIKEEKRRREPSSWDKVIQKQREQTNRQLFKAKGLPSPYPEEETKKKEEEKKRKFAPKTVLRDKEEDGDDILDLTED